LVIIKQISNTMAKILVTGHGGQLSSEIQALQKAYPKFEFVFASIEDLDITDDLDVGDYIAKGNYNYCVNAAAYTAVDKAEEDASLCRAVNAEGVKHLAKACDLYGVKLIHVSSDYVYHNEINRPLLENDPTSPKGVYAVTKLEGDNYALDHTKAIVLRTSWVYSSFGNNFVKTMIRLGTERDTLGIIYDQIGAPTYAKDLATAILEIIQSNENDNIDFNALSGIYHYCNEGVTTWYDFAKAIFRHENISVDVSPILTSDYPTKASRPHYSVLNKAKFKNTFQQTIPHWEDSLIECLNTLEASA